MFSGVPRPGGGGMMGGAQIKSLKPHELVAGGAGGSVKIHKTLVGRSGYDYVPVNREAIDQAEAMARKDPILGSALSAIFSVAADARVFIRPKPVNIDPAVFLEDSIGHVMDPNLPPEETKEKKKEKKERGKGAQQHQTVVPEVTDALQTWVSETLGGMVLPATRQLALFGFVAFRIRRRLKKGVTPEPFVVPLSMINVVVEFNLRASTWKYIAINTEDGAEMPDVHIFAIDEPNRNGDLNSPVSALIDGFTFRNALLASNILHEAALHNKMNILEQTSGAGQRDPQVRTSAYSDPHMIADGLNKTFMYQDATAGHDLEHIEMEHHRAVAAGVDAHHTYICPQGYRMTWEPRIAPRTDLPVIERERTDAVFARMGVPGSLFMQRANSSSDAATATRAFNQTMRMYGDKLARLFNEVYVRIYGGADPIAINVQMTKQINIDGVIVAGDRGYIDPEDEAALALQAIGIPTQLNIFEKHPSLTRKAQKRRHDMLSIGEGGGQTSELEKQKTLVEIAETKAGAAEKAEMKSEGEKPSSSSSTSTTPAKSDGGGRGGEPMDIVEDGAGEKESDKPKKEEEEEEKEEEKEVVVEVDSAFACASNETHQ